MVGFADLMMMAASKWLQESWYNFARSFYEVLLCAFWRIHVRDIIRNALTAKATVIFGRVLGY